MSPVEDDDAEEEGKASYDTTIMPEFVIALEATDEFLKNRVMNLPESVVAGTHNTEKELMRRLAEYRANNTEDETVLNYFDELEFHPERIGKFCEGGWCVVCVCMCVCVCACVCVCELCVSVVCVCACTGMHACVHMCVHGVCLHACMCSWRMYVCICVCVCGGGCMCVCGVGVHVRMHVGVVG